MEAGGRDGGEGDGDEGSAGLTMLEACQSNCVLRCDQARRMEDDLETKCVTRKSSDATPGNFKKTWLENTPKMNEPTLPEPTPCFFTNFRTASSNRPAKNQNKQVFFEDLRKGTPVKFEG